ncbi:MAG: OmpA family protein [Desulfobacteraceae bacterium]|nr:OmpA family protein [Desulfobacteraceae bacterium]
MKILKIFVILFSFLLVLASSAWSTEYSNAILNSNLHKSTDLYERVKQYESKIENINEQIKSIMDEMDWLYLNMERIKDSERKVPYSFFRSIKEKKYNIRRLQKERSRYYALVESFLDEINNRILKKEKYSIQESRAEKGIIQEETIHGQKKEVLENKTPSELNQSENDIQKNAYFEKLSSETQRLESLLDRYAGLIEDGKKVTAETIEPKLITKSEKVQAVEIIEEKSVFKPIAKNYAEKNGIDKSKLFIEIKKAGLSDWVDISDTGECLKLKTTLPILFPVGSAEIAKEYKPFFMRFANLLKAYDVQILVNGYADIDSINTKKYPSNFELGAIRAANVVHELIKNGLKPSIFKINSSG